MTRRTDTDLRLVLAELEQLDGDAGDAACELIREVLEARRRGVTGTVDVIAQAEEGDPVAYADGIYVAGSGLHFVSWCPDDEAKEPPTQVHMIQNLGPAMGNAKAVIRLKSGVGVDKIIAALYEHRCFVWPDYKGIRVNGVVFK